MIRIEDAKNALVKFAKEEDGLTTVEYAVAGALVVGALVTAFTGLGGAVQGEITRLTTAITGG